MYSKYTYDYIFFKRIFVLNWALFKICYKQGDQTANHPFGICLLASVFFENYKSTRKFEAIFSDSKMCVFI
jgi:hypothetical protein